MWSLRFLTTPAIGEIAPGMPSRRSPFADRHLDLADEGDHRL